MVDYEGFTSPYPITGEPICFAGAEAFEKRAKLHTTYIPDRNIPAFLRLSIEEITGSMESKTNKSIDVYTTDARTIPVAPRDKKLPEVRKAVSLEKVQRRGLR